MSENTCLEKQPLCDEMLQKMDTYWRAANYLSAGQLYLLDNPLLRKPLTAEGPPCRRADKEKNCRSLGNSTGTELCLDSL